jgi:hypothetical protein
MKFLAAEEPPISSGVVWAVAVPAIPARASAPVRIERYCLVNVMLESPY